MFYGISRKGIKLGYAATWSVTSKNNSGTFAESALVYLASYNRNGKLFHTDHCYYRNINYYHSRFGCAEFRLDEGEHTVEIKVLGTKPTNDSADTKVCIVNVFYGMIDR